MKKAIIALCLMVALLTAPRIAQAHGYPSIWEYAALIPVAVVFGAVYYVTMPIWWPIHKLHEVCSDDNATEEKR